MAPPTLQLKIWFTTKRQLFPPKDEGLVEYRLDNFQNLKKLFYKKTRWEIDLKEEIIGPPYLTNLDVAWTLASIKVRVSVRRIIRKIPVKISQPLSLCQTSITKDLVYYETVCNCVTYFSVSWLIQEIKELKRLYTTNNRKKRSCYILTRVDFSFLHWRNIFL